MLCVVQRTPATVHPLLLGALLDLCEGPKALPHLAAWRGACDISAAHLLCHLWRAEECRMGALRTESGVMAGRIGFALIAGVCRKWVRDRVKVSLAGCTLCNYVV